MTGYLAATAVRITVPLLLGWATCLLLRSRDAATRHGVWSLTVLSGLAMLFLPGLLPAWELPVPALGPDGGVAAGSAPTDAGSLLVGGAWLGGALVLLGLFVASVVRLGRWAADGRPLPADHRVRRLAAELVGAGEIPLRVSPSTPVPFVWGLLRPTVVLPSRAVNWPEPDLRSVLIHELGHVRHHDTWLRILGELFRVVFWFHPLVWLCLARFREESEAACDALVVSDGRCRAEYARQLLSFGTRGRRPPELALSLVSSGRLRRRIERIVSGLDRRAVPAPIRRSFAAAWLASTVAVASCVPVASGSPAGEGPPPGPPEPPRATEVLPEETSTSTGIRETTEKGGRTVTRNLDRTVTRTVARTVTNRVERPVEAHRTLHRQVTRQVTVDRTRTVTVTRQVSHDLPEG